jgi:DMSO reductase anchor subunit
METRFAHVVPLLIFTSLAIIGTGLVTANHFYDHSEPLDLYLFYGALICTMVGGAASFLHLGKKGRSPRAILGVAHSWLSREVLFLAFFGMAVIATIVYARLDMSDYQTSFTAISTVCGLVLCFTIGMVYNLPAQVAWRGLLNLSQPVIGALVLASVLYPPEGQMAWRYATILGVDIVFAVLRFRRHHQLSGLQDAVIFKQEYKWLDRLWIVRQSLWAFIVAAVFAGLPLVAGFLAAVMIVIDRFILYASAVQLKPESLIAEERNRRMDAAGE